ncbi:MAG: zinc ribbon domain-containing protein [Ruminococcus flavefaciens]|nr:zinc ribbon domain-containing protein [Ruminococcus flavefaciens]
MGFLDSMKDFAGKVGNTVEKGAKSVSDSSKKMAEKSRLKKEISQLETEVNSAYISIGKVYFDRISANPDPECENAVETITTKGERIEQLRKVLSSLEDKIPCPSCGADILKGQKFCDKCGAKIEVDVAVEKAEPVIIEPVAEPVAEQQSDKKICSECGTPADADQLFCQQCGKKF